MEIQTGKIAGSIFEFDSALVPAEDITVIAVPTLGRIANDEGDTVLLTSQSTTVNPDGTYELELPAHDSPGFSPNGWGWKVSIRSPRRTYKPVETLVGAGATVPLNAPVEPTQVVHVVQGKPGVRGSMWFISSPETPDPVNVTGMILGDLFLYPSSRDIFRFDGNEWLYAGTLAS